MKKTRKKTVLNGALLELRNFIKSGKYPGGRFLPPENQLSIEMNISRGTLRAILRVLERENLIRIVPGKGSYVLGGNNFGRFERFIAGNFYPTVMQEREALALIKGSCKAAHELHAECILSFDAIKEPQKLIDRFYRGNINGVLYIESHNYESEIVPLEKAGVPYVIANFEHDSPAVATRVDFREVGRIAARHLAELGHRNIAVLSGLQEQFIYREILAGFRGGLAENEIYLDPQNIIFCKSTFKASEAAANKLLELKDHFTAVFTIRDIRASGLFQACHSQGILIPRDISVISYDNITWEGAASVGLTTIREKTEELAATAVKMLKNWYCTGVRPESVYCDTELIVRSSTCAWDVSRI
jgi:LacI family transcriptional regulator